MGARHRRHPDDRYPVTVGYLLRRIAVQRRRARPVWPVHDPDHPSRVDGGW
jgi:hypothetical protein